LNAYLQNHIWHSVVFFRTFSFSHQWG
jgi:hypothetical protein